MAAEGVRIEGLEALTAKLKEMPRVMRNRVLKNALSAGARLVRDEAKRNAPLLSLQAKAPYRTRGTVQKAITVRASKVARRAGDVGVFVNVRPAKSGQRGAKSKTDPFYWKFLEFGTKRMSARSFLKPAAARLGDALKAFEASLGKWVSKVEASGKVQP